MAKKVYGKLEGENKVNLGIAENFGEYLEIKREYRNVFGYDISFNVEEMSKEEYTAAKAKAWSKLFASLFGPITNVLTSITQTKK